MMKTLRILFCLVIGLLAVAEGHAAQEDFKSFLTHFTTSASFQYARVKFPLQSPIILLEDDGETERTFPFTRDRWPLLNADNFLEGRQADEEGGVYVSRFTVDEAAHKEFEAGYEESEPSLRVVFDCIDGLWFVTDCYNDWYNIDLPIGELEETVATIQEENAAFREQYP